MSRIENVTQYTVREGGMWREWPWRDHLFCNPTENQLRYTRGRDRVHLNLKYPGGAKIRMPVHSLRLQDGREWDCINGYRK